MHTSTAAIVLAGTLTALTAAPIAAGPASPAVTQNAASLTGTYRLDSAQSDDPDRVAQQVTDRLNQADRARLERQVANRLTPPEELALETSGRQVTLASSTGPQTTIEATGETHVERNANGRDVTTRATLSRDQLEIRRTGGGGTDFTVTFEPLGRGESLLVTRELYNDIVQHPITVKSVYRRTSDAANWNIYEGRPTRAAARASSSPRSTVRTTVPEGTRLVATLNEPLDVPNARDGQPVSLTVQDTTAGRFDGAVISGYVNGDPSRSGDQTGLSLDFDTIRLRGGQTADFAGTIDRIRDPQGRDVPFDTPAAAGPSQNDEMLRRGAVGAALGAIIGAVAGGGKGAAIGAAVGAGGGAGTVLIGNRDQMNLPRGTEFTIQSRTP
jgi:hypothetical protein